MTHTDDLRERVTELADRLALNTSDHERGGITTAEYLSAARETANDILAAAGPEADWLDAALDSVHPLARVDVVASYVDDSCPNDEIEIGGWRAYVSYPEKGKRTMGFEAVYAEGPTRTAAIRNAIATALAAKQEGAGK